MDGAHSMARCAEVTEAVLHEVFHALHRHAVVLEHMLLKPSMVLPGKEAGHAAPDEVAMQTVQVLKRTVPAAVPGIFFLSGGQTPTEATVNLDAMNRLAPLPWRLSFSYGRALQEPPLLAWRGDAANAAQAQRVLLQRSRLNAMACLGQYDEAQENAAG
ncbi:Fructose-bisphosphate aldolase class-I [compost metagenome]